MYSWRLGISDILVCVMLWSLVANSTSAGLGQLLRFWLLVLPNESKRRASQPSKRLPPTHTGGHPERHHHVLAFVAAFCLTLCDLLLHTLLNFLNQSIALDLARIGVAIIRCLPFLSSVTTKKISIDRLRGDGERNELITLGLFFLLTYLFVFFSIHQP